jgi:hypothetical protein
MLLPAHQHENKINISTALLILHPSLCRLYRLYRSGYIKRDGKTRESEVLVSRLVDRPLRPMFAEGWANETQVSVTSRGVGQ